MFKAYKVFNSVWTCNRQQFEVGKRYTEYYDKQKNVVTDGSLILCEQGFHFCRKLTKCFNYYDFDPSNKVAEIIVWGDFVGDPDDKECTNDFEIVCEIGWNDVLLLVNSGDYNSGYKNSGNYNSGIYNSGDYNSGYKNSGNYNSGDYNSGDKNSGIYNSGDYNSGYKNSGDYNSGYKNSGNYNSGNCNSGNYNSGSKNSGNYNSGYKNSGSYNSGDYNSGSFNTVTPDTIMFFNKPLMIGIYETLILPSFLYFALEEFVAVSDMTEDEKYDHKIDVDTIGGFFRQLNYKKQFQSAWKSAPQHEKEIVMNWPNFDPEVWYAITGIRI